jgi:hypothetical protein
MLEDHLSQVSVYPREIMELYLAICNGCLWFREVAHPSRPAGVPHHGTIRYESEWSVSLFVLAGMKLIQPFTLVWLPPTPTMAISEMPTDESQRPMEA